VQSLGAQENCFKLPHGRAINLSKQRSYLGFPRKAEKINGRAPVSGRALKIVEVFLFNHPNIHTRTIRIMKNRLSILTIASLALGTSLFSTSEAAAFSITKDQVTAADMLGMKITVEYEDSTSESGVWSDLGSNNYGVLGTSFFLKLAGGVDTFSATNWGFKAIDKTVTTLTIDALAGNTAFDNFFNPDYLANDPDRLEGFLGSENGFEVTQSSLSNQGATVTHEYLTPLCSGVVNLSATQTGCDLYGGLKLNFSNFTANSTLRFRADTDNVFVPTSVPESSAVVPWMLGLMGLGLKRLTQKD
jgi:hypothetical protein